MHIFSSVKQSRQANWHRAAVSEALWHF